MSLIVLGGKGVMGLVLSYASYYSIQVFQAFSVVSINTKNTTLWILFTVSFLKSQ